MGSTHSLSGAVAFLAAAPWLNLGSPAEVAVGAVCAAGAAMLPDMDHHDGTIANMFGPVSRLLCRVVAFVSGGHRHGTHSLIGVGAFTAVAWWSTNVRAWPLVVLMTLLAGLACRALLPRGRDREWKLDWADIASTVTALVAAWVAWRLVGSGMDLSVVPYAVAVGCAAHIAGDILTKRGCPLLWPLPKRFRVASITTDSWVEKWLVVPALYAALGAIAVYTTTGFWRPTVAALIAGG
jgi:membrane-bound metal-dependent hydrolase YbcI (DUF457 family)